jgi:hypothetical protein
VIGEEECGEEISLWREGGPEEWFHGAEKKDVLMADTWTQHANMVTKPDLM